MTIALCVFVNGELALGFLELSLSFYDRPNISDRFPSHFIFVVTKMKLVIEHIFSFSGSLISFCSSQQFVKIPTKKYTFYPGDTAQVCQSQDNNEFSCPTTDSSTNITCDTDRCPLEGPPMAPLMDLQILTGCC